jgi:CheY-like chemotaxis protein
MRSAGESAVVQHRVLVADDNIDAATSLATLLELRGHEVVVAHDRYEAVMKTGAFNPDVIFLDLGVPKMNGIEAAHQIRSLPQGQHITVVALTGWGKQQIAIGPLAAGFDLHLVNLWVRER